MEINLQLTLKLKWCFRQAEVQWGWGAQGWRQPAGVHGGWGRVHAHQLEGRGQPRTRRLYLEPQGVGQVDLNPFSGRRSTSVKDHRQGEKKLTYKFEIAFIKRAHNLKSLENPFENISWFYIWNSSKSITSKSPRSFLTKPLLNFRERVRWMWAKHDARMPGNTKSRRPTRRAKPTLKSNWMSNMHPGNITNHIFPASIKFIQLSGLRNSIDNTFLHKNTHYEMNGKP